MITILKDEGGVLLGADENGFYDGRYEMIGDDELTIETTVADDGQSFERVTSYQGQVIARGTATRQGVLDAYSAVTDPDEQESLWQREIAIEQHSKTFVSVMVDGEMQSMEKKRKILIWEQRGPVSTTTANAGGKAGR